MATNMQIQTSKASNEKVTGIKDVRPWKNIWFVHVKVLHSWKQNIQLSEETMEFILADENVSNRNCLLIFFEICIFCRLCII